VAFDKEMNVIKEFPGMGDHFGNFLDACRARDYTLLNADVREGHLSAAISHLGNISYYLGEQNHVSPDELRAALQGIKSLDDNSATLDRTLAHLTKNGVELDKYPLSLGAHLKFDPDREVFPDSDEATALVSREYRDEFRCPTASEV